MRFARLWINVFPKVSVDHGCSSFRQNVKLSLTWMIWSRAKYQPWNCGNSMKRFHCGGIGLQKGVPRKQYMLWNVFLCPLQVAVKQTWFRHHQLLLLWLACLHVQHGSRFHLCLRYSPVSCLKTEGPMPEEALESLPQSGFDSAPPSFAFAIRACGFGEWRFAWLSGRFQEKLRCLSAFLPFAILHVCQLTALQCHKV